MKNVLISGLNGFVGTNLAKHLRANDYVINSLSRQNKAGEATFMWGDLNELKNHSPDSIIHLAGKAHDVKRIRL